MTISLKGQRNPSVKKLDHTSSLSSLQFLSQVIADKQSDGHIFQADAVKLIYFSIQMLHEFYYNNAVVLQSKHLLMVYMTP